MKALGAGRFAVIGLSIASLAGALAALVGSRAAGLDLTWVAIGWLLMASIGLSSGIAMERAHGRRFNAFLGALVVGMLARLFGAAAGIWLATTAGSEAVWAYLTGIAAGYLPLQAFEIVWFLRKSRAVWPTGVRTGSLEGR